MLVLTRKLNQQVSLGDNIKVTILQITKGCIRLGIEAPREMKILRSEVQERDQRATKNGPRTEALRFESRSEDSSKTGSVSASQGLTEEAFSMLEIDVESFAAELLAAERYENDLGLSEGTKLACAQPSSLENTRDIQVEETIDGVVYQTRSRAPLSRFVRSTVRETDIAYSLF